MALTYPSPILVSQPWETRKYRFTVSELPDVILDFGSDHPEEVWAAGSFTPKWSDSRLNGNVFELQSAWKPWNWMGDGIGFWSVPVLASEPKVVRVKDYGAVGDGIADDTQAIQVALDSIGPYGGSVKFQSGTYRVTSRLKTGILPGRSQGGLRISGVSGGPLGGTVLKWDGPATEGSYPSNMLQLAAFDSIVEHLSFQVAPGKQIGALLNFGYFPGETPAFVTGSTVQHCHLAGTKTGIAGTLIAWDYYNIANGNGENCSIRKCLLYGATEQCAWLRGGQPFNIVFDGCFFNNAGMSSLGVHSPYGVGIRVSTAASQLQVQSCSFQRVGTHLHFESPPTSTVIQNCESEQFKKILYWPSAGAGHNATFSVLGGRYSTLGVAEECQGYLSFPASDHRAIWHQGDGPITLQGLCAFGSGEVSSPFKVATISADVMSRGNLYPNLDPFERITAPWDVRKPGRTYSTGDYASAPGGFKQAISTLSGHPEPDGEVVISTEPVEVVFANPEPALSPAGLNTAAPYKVNLTVTGVSEGAQPSVAWISDISRTGFTVNLTQYPSMGTVTVGYRIFR